MKKWIQLILVLTIIGVLAACNNGNIDDSDAVVETKDGNVTKEEFYNAMKEVAGEQVLKRLVELEVLEDKFEVTEDEVDKEVELLKNDLGSEEAFQQQLEASGFSEDDLRKLIKENLVYFKAQTEGIEASEDELNELYETNFKVSEVKVRHILVPDEETANEVKEKLDAGEDFEKLVEEYSTDPGSKDKGGVYDFFPRGQMAPEFDQAVFTLEKGVISDPVQTQHGFHIIEVLDQKTAEFKDVEYEIEKQVLLQKAQENAAEQTNKINKYLNDADIDIKDTDYEDLFQYVEEALKAEENKEEE